LPLPLPGQVFLFGRVGGWEDAPPARELKLNGRTGLGWRMPLGPGAEVLLRSGPALSGTDPSRVDRAWADSQLFLEMQCRWQLLGWAGLEYQGAASQARTHTEQGRLDQDLGIAFPLGKAGQLRVGTKYSWEGAPEPKPWTDGLRFQLGSSLRW